MATDLSPMQLVEYFPKDHEELLQQRRQVTSTGDIRSFGEAVIEKNAAQFAIRVQTKRISARPTRMERGEGMTVSTKVGCQGDDNKARRETKRMDELVVVKP